MATITEQINQIWKTTTSTQSFDKKARNLFWQTRKWALNQEPADLDPSLIKALDKMDKYSFSRWTPWRMFSPRFSGILLYNGIILEFLFLLLWFVFYPSFNYKILGFGLVIAILFLQTYFLHVPGHHIVGKFFKIRTSNIFIARTTLRKAPFPFRIIGKIGYVPGLKYDLESLLLQDRWKRALMLSAGVLLSYGLFAFNLIAIILIPINNQPEWIPSITLILLIS
ncbi:MAG: hypothetical protein ACFFCQ_10240, partial [Promethearchaeota archaeon]